MTLFKYELIKISRNLLIWILVFALSILVFLSISNQISNTKIKSEETLSYVLEEYKKNPEEFQKYIDSYLAAYKASTIGPPGAARPPKPESIYSRNDYFLFTDSFDKLINYTSYYQNDIKEAIRISKGRIKTCQYLGYSSDSFEWMYYQNLINTYESLQNLEFNKVNIVGYDLFFSYSDSSIYTMAIVVLIAIISLSYEKSNNMLFTLHSLKNGRAKTLLAKVAAGFVFTVFITAFLSIICLVTIYFKIGLIGISEPIQIIEQMKYCPYHISIGQGVFLIILFRIFSSFTLFTIVLLISSLLNNFAFSFLLSSMIIGLNYGIANMTYLNNYSFLKNVNLFWSIDGSKYIEQWQGVLLWQRCVNRTPLLIISYSTIIVICTICATISFSNKRVSSQSSKAFEKIKNFITEHLSMQIHKSRLLLFEIKKIITPLAAVILIICTFSSIYLSKSAYIIKKDYLITKYSEYMNLLDGEWTQEKHDYIDNELHENNLLINDYAYMTSRFEKGSITYYEYQSYLNKSMVARQDIAILSKIEKHSEYLKSLTESGKKAYFFDDTWCTYLSKNNFSYVLCLAFIIIFSDVYAIEYRTKFYQIQHSHKNGRYRIDLQKFSIVIITSIIISLAFEIIQFAYVHKGFNFHGLDYTAVSFEHTKNPGNLTIQAYYLLSIIKNTLIYSALSTSVVLLSKYAKNIITTLIIPSLIVFIPTLLSFFGVSSLNSLSFLNLFRR